MMNFYAESNKPTFLERRSKKITPMHLFCISVLLLLNLVI